MAAIKKALGILAVCGIIYAIACCIVVVYSNYKEKNLREKVPYMFSFNRHWYLGSNPRKSLPEEQWYDYLPVIGNRIFKKPVIVLSHEDLTGIPSYSSNWVYSYTCFSSSEKITYEIKGLLMFDASKNIEYSDWHSRRSKDYYSPETFFYFDGKFIVIYYDHYNKVFPRIYENISQDEALAKDLENYSDYRTTFITEGQENSNIAKKEHDSLRPWLMTRKEALEILGGEGELLIKYEHEGREYETIGYKSETDIIFVTYASDLLVGCEYVKRNYFLKY